MRAMAGRRAAPPKTPLPASYEPQLALLVKEPPAGEDWLHEMKYDGYRIGCRVDGSDVRLISRRGKDWTEAFPEVCVAARKLPSKRVLLDGEVAIVLPDGKTSFQALQNFFGGSDRRGLAYFVFDLLHLDGTDVSALPLEARKQALQELVGEGQGLIRYSGHVIGDGRAFFAQACHHGLEGIVSKLRAQPYQAGRNTGWVKTKCIKRQELVIGGFTDPEGSRQGIGALLVGVHDGAGQLLFAGKVGTGFTHKAAGDLRKRLDALEQADCPFSPRPTGWLGGHAHWVRPALVAEVAFAEWTGDGKVRHASFQGLRADKRPEEVVAETPVAPPAPGEAPRAVVKSRAGKKGKPAGEKPLVEMAGVRLSHPDRPLYPEVGITKQGLAEFYLSIADWILPHVKGRPLTLVRCPQGLQADKEDGGCHYMKHTDVWAPEALRRVRIKEKTKVGEYLVIEDIAGVVGLVQMDILEIHTWNSLADAVEHPNRVVFDLDPGPQVKWATVVEAARVLRGALASLELESFVKNTGGRGLHVVVPIAPDRTWDECLTFSRDLASAIARRNRDQYTVALAKAGREDKILIDYLRNNRTNTSVAAFSTRARPTAPVSVTLTWEELTPRIPSDHYTALTVRDRLSRLRFDPWQGYWRCRQKLSKAAMRAAADVG
jgi:bifunctional non-homologous end joining protein LigD